MSLRWVLLAPVYDRMSRQSEDEGLRAMRQDLLRDAAGRVLEIGAGTGVNLPHYTGVESLALTEPEPPMLRRLQRAAREHAPQAQVLRAPAEDLPFEDDSFDTVVSTLVLCGVDDQPRALREARRVLRPGGRLLFLEHVRADDPALARFQDRMNWLNNLVVGCDCNRPPVATIEAEGFAVTRLDRTVMPKAPTFVRPLAVGVATSPARS
jgi:ubiquinone/menaquinone biosynthesis C-methylase UbiE